MGPKSGRRHKKAKHRRALEHGRDLRRAARREIARLIRGGYTIQMGKWYGGGGVYAGHHPYSSSRSRHRSGGKPRK